MQEGVQRTRELVAKHRLGQSDTHSGLDGGVLLEKELTETALHRARGGLVESFLQLNDIAFSLTIRGGVVGSRCHSLDTILLVKCSDLVEHERCVIIRRCPPRNTEHCKGRTQHTDDCCRGRMSHLVCTLTMTSAFHWLGKVIIQHMPQF